MSDRTVPTIDADMPALFTAADEKAIVSQRRFFRAIETQIFFLLLGSVVGTLASALDADWLALIGVASYTVVVVQRIHARSSSLEVAWYDGRLAAESVKSLSWRYAVGAEPFEQGKADREADRLFAERLWNILGELQEAILPPRGAEGDQITPTMREMRAMPLEARIDAYRIGRIEDQSRWYSGKSQRNDRAARWWDVAFVVLSTVAIFFGILQAIDLLDVNLLGITGYAAALITTWAGVNRYDRVARAYGRTAHELLAMRSLIVTLESEEEWSDFVDDAESAISAEHSAWQSLRQRS